LKCNQLGDKRNAMPYWLRFSIFLTVASALAFIGGQLVSEFGLIANIMLAIIAAYVALAVGQKVLRRERL
jgi:hypothetical protein